MLEHYQVRAGFNDDHVGDFERDPWEVAGNSLVARRGSIAPSDWPVSHPSVRDVGSERASGQTGADLCVPSSLDEGLNQQVPALVPAASEPFGLDNGSEGRRFGYPTMNEYAIGDGGYAQDHQGGRVTWRPGNLTVEWAS